jgi:hypothetical protein
MTIEQQKSTQTQIDLFKTLELESLLAKAYPNQTELGNTIINRMTVVEFVHLSKRLIISLEKELNTENRVILPYLFVTPEFGQSSVDSTLGNLISYIKSLQFGNAETALLWLAHYQLQNGFYDKSKIKFHTADVVSVQKAQNELDIVSAAYNSLSGRYATLLANIEVQTTQLSELYNQKQVELQQITNNLTTTNTNTNQIQGLLNNSIQSETRIKSTAEQVEKEKIKIDTFFQELSNRSSETNKQYNVLLNDLRLRVTEFEVKDKKFLEALDFVESKHIYFRERNDYLDSLIGREVGASLFETFKQRKAELEKPLNWWRIAVGVMAALTFLVVLSIFTNFFGRFGPIETSIHWENIVINTLKASPFFFLLYYTISQYNKERNFQEEYAFKSAAALTIKAYTDILKDDKNKDEFVLRAVTNIYRSPIYSKIKSTKEINSALDMVQDVMSKGAELVSKK